ncbi:MAG: nucleotide exchange factor GrpE [Candidatus Omnitrophica bacterium]|nr:nucleotide exchange factor GrpE [Candidatus Omnitrophota bacterium]
MLDNDTDRNSESTGSDYAAEEAVFESESAPQDAQPEEAQAPSLESKVQELQAKLKEADEKVLRVAADFDNDKKRIQKRAEEMLKYANEKIVTDLLPLIDDFDRALESLNQGHDLKTIQQGLNMVQTSFHKILSENGVEQIDALNKPFDPNLHEAVGQVISDAEEEDTVVEEMQRGYTLNGRLARPSRVKVSKKS